jgi:exodeoxyribonuclease V alpha subunit
MNDSNRGQFFTPLDRHFARFLGGLATVATDEVFLAAALLSRATGAGDVCLDLAAVAGQPVPAGAGIDSPAVFPELDAWSAALRSSAVVGSPGQKRPLVLDDRNRLYLRRYWEYEQAAAQSVRERAGGRPGELDTERLRKGLAGVFPDGPGGEINWQKTAAAIAALKGFSVITGGPGTGKTFTIARLLVLLMEQHPERRLRIHLAAPTGKAAARMRESLKQAREGLRSRHPVADQLPEEVHTLHRLLGTRPGTPYFRHDRENPLETDIVVVDEASMVDIALMAKLLEAVPSAARLVLVGDKDQLASVEAGSVLGDICDRGRMHGHGFSAGFRETLQQATGERMDAQSGRGSGLQDCMVELRTSFRFSAGSAIGELSRAVNRGEAGRALAILDTSREGSIVWLDPDAGAHAPIALERLILSGTEACFSKNTAAAALQELGRFKILCAHKSGPYGVDAINRAAEQLLVSRGLVRSAAGPASPWYAHRPVLVSRNDYALGLFNGDIGMTLPDDTSGGRGLFVFFPGASGEMRRFLPYRLPPHETVYAMTVHKSQGSEFDEVLLVLPDRDSPVLTRELVYTALTRARKTVTIWARRPILAAAITRRIERTSGLRDALWGRG